MAHIKLDARADGSGGTWWRFDDETVTKMEDGPFGTTDHGAGAGGITGIASNKGGRSTGGSGSGSGGAGGSKKTRGNPGSTTLQTGKGAKNDASKGKRGRKGPAGGVDTEKKPPAKKKKKKKAPGRKKKQNEWSSSEAEDKADDDAGEQIKADFTMVPSAGATGGDISSAVEVVDLLDGEAEQETKNQKTEIVSSNAYLLVYRRRRPSVSDQPSPAPGAASAAAGAGENKNGLRLGTALDPETTQWLLDSKSRLAEEFDKQCEAYKTAKADAELQQTARRQEVRNLLESAAGFGSNNSNTTDNDIVEIITVEGEEEEKKAEIATEKSQDRPKKRSTIIPPPPPQQQQQQQQVSGKSSIFEGDCGRFISATWLQQWADAPASSPPPPIDNAPLLCPHGKLDPSRPTVMRRLPTHAWTALASTYRGGPEVKPRDACPICLGEILESIAAAEDSSEARDHYLDVAGWLLSSLNNALEEEEEEEEEFDSGIEIMEEKTNGGGSHRTAKKIKSSKKSADDDDDEINGIGGGVPAYYVSKSWLQAWHRRGGKSMGTTPPTQSLRCPHGCLMPEPQSSSSTKGGGKSSKKIGISDDFWAFLKQSWQFSETERLRKARAKAAEKLRRNQGGAAVLPESAEKQKKLKNDVDMEMIEIDGEEVLIPKEKKTYTDKRDTTNNTKKLEEKSEAIEILDSPRAVTEAADTNTNTNTDNSSTLLEMTPLAEFSLHTEECPMCRAEIEQVTRVSKNIHSRVQTEKSSLAHLLIPGFMQLTQGETYYLIPRAFMDHWRAYMTQASAGRRGGAAAAAAAVVAAAGMTTSSSEFLEAPRLAEYMKRAACDCHSDPPLLAFAPPAVVNRRGRWLVVNHSENNNPTANTYVGAAGAGAHVEDTSGFFELVSVVDWLAFVEHYAEEELVCGIDGISATLQIEDSSLMMMMMEKNEDVNERQQQQETASEVKKNDGGDKIAKEIGEDEAMPDVPAVTTRKKAKAQVREATAMVGKNQEEEEDPDAQLARAIAAVEAEDAKAAAKENGEIDSDEEEEHKEEEDDEEQDRKKKNIKKKKIKKKNLDADDLDDDLVPASQPDDQGTVFGQDPEFLYDRKPGTRNAHLRPGAAGKAWLVTVPSTCTATLEARQRALKAARLSYTGAEIMVEVCLTDEEAITATLVAVPAPTGGGLGARTRVGVVGGGNGGSDVVGERKSKRARKGRAPVIIDCTSTLHDLRLRIYQAVGVHPRNARVYCRGQIISDTTDEVTVSDLEIYPNEEIRVVDTQEHDPDDLTGLFLSSPGGGQGKKGRRGGPEGFGGTALTGLHLVESSSHHHQHQYDNDDIDMQ